MAKEQIITTKVDSENERKGLFERVEDPKELILYKLNPNDDERKIAVTTDNFAEQLQAQESIVNNIVNNSITNNIITEMLNPNTSQMKVLRNHIYDLLIYNITFHMKLKKCCYQVDIVIKKNI